MATNIYNNSSFADAPLGLKLRHTITSSGSVTGIPSNIKRVYAVCIGGGGGGGSTYLGMIRKVTAVSGDGTTQTYTCDNNFVAGMQVTTAGASVTGYNVTNATILTATSTNFTVAGATTSAATVTQGRADARTVATGATAGGTITAITASSPVANQVTYSTSAYVPVGTYVTISGATPSGYNGSYGVIASTPGTSFTVWNTTTGAASGTITFVGIMTITAANNYRAGSIISNTNFNPTTFNANTQTVIYADATRYVLPSQIAQNTTWTSGGNSSFAVTTSAFNGGGGGAGGFSAGWTTVPSTCEVGLGGAGGQMGLPFNSSNIVQSDINANNPNGYGGRGGDTVFGQVIAGGGQGGGGMNNIFYSAGVYNLQPRVGAGGGGAITGNTSFNAPGVSYTGAPSTTGQIGYGAAGGGNANGFDGVSGGGGGSNSSSINSSVTGRSGGTGVIGGGGASILTLIATSVGGAGGNGDKYTGGTGSTGDWATGGAGGGGAGYLGNGSNASGKQGGAGGDGGGGGGGSSGDGDTQGGNGGNGVIFIYY